MSFSSELNEKSILITGGTGSFGHQMIFELMKYSPKRVVVFSRDEEKQHNMRETFRQYPIFEKINFVIGDIRDYERLNNSLKNIDIVFHAAAMKQVPYIEEHPYEAVKTNVFGAYNVIRAAVKNDVKYLVGISTDKAVKPINAMGMTKAIQEKIFLGNDLNKNNTKISCVRYGNVIGSRGSVIPLFDEKIKKQESLPITHPMMTRFMLTLKDAIQLVFFAVKSSKGGEIFVKKAPNIKIVDFAKAYAEIKTGNSKYPLKYVGIRPGEKLYEVLISSEEMRRTEEEKDYFIIKKQDDFYDSKALDEQKSLEEYSSLTESCINYEELKKILEKRSWVN